MTTLPVADKPDRCYHYRQTTARAGGAPTPTGPLAGTPERPGGQHMPSVPHMPIEAPGGAAVGGFVVGGGPYRMRAYALAVTA